MSMIYFGKMLFKSNKIGFSVHALKLESALKIYDEIQSVQTNKEAKENE